VCERHVRWLGVSEHMAEKPQRVRKAVLPAAGLGTRFLPATKAQPKEMLAVVDKPLIQYVVEECVASEIENIIIVTGRGKNAIEDHFDSSPELEHFLVSKGKSELAKPSATRGRKSRSALDTPSWWQKIWWAMNRSLCCLAM
jgi:UTP-glucose-1-phosphate uridylyltransferase